MLELTAADLDGALLVGEGAELAAGGARLGSAQTLGLLSSGLLQDASREAAGGSDGDLLHGVEIDVEVRAIVPKSVAANDLAPLVGQIMDFLEVLGRELAGRHDLNLLTVTANAMGEFLLVVIERALCPAKRCLHSIHAARCGWPTAAALAVVS